MRTRFASFPGRVTLALFFFGAGAWLPSACHLVLDDIDPADDPPTPSRGGHEGKGGASSAGGTTAVGVGGATDSTTSAFCPGDMAYFCKDRTLVDCATGASTVCRSATLCQALGDAKCLECSPGERTCQDNVLKRCNATRDGWDVERICSGDTPVCDVDAKECVVCGRNDSRCQGTTLYVCSLTEPPTWVTRRDCSTLIDPRGCVADDARHAHCVDCDPDDYTPACSTSSIVQRCEAGVLVSETCSNGCVDAVGASAAYCR